MDRMIKLLVLPVGRRVLSTPRLLRLVLHYHGKGIWRVLPVGNMSLSQLTAQLHFVKRGHRPSGGSGQSNGQEDRQRWTDASDFSRLGCHPLIAFVAIAHCFSDKGPNGGSFNFNAGTSHTRLFKMLKSARTLEEAEKLIETIPEREINKKHQYGKLRSLRVVTEYLIESFEILGGHYCTSLRPIQIRSP